MSKSIKNRKVRICVSEVKSLVDIAHELVLTLNREDVAYLVALLDHFAQDWGVTETIINHFDAIKKNYLDSIDPIEQNLKPKDLLAHFKKTN